MLFQNKFFNILEQDKYYKYQFKDGFKDKTISDFQFLSYSPMLKVEVKKEKSENEFILSYLKAAEIIANQCKINNPAIKMVLFDYSLALPAIFCCRQSIELTLKKTLYDFSVNYKYYHNITELWSLLKNELKVECENNDNDILNNMEKFIKIICYFDNDNSTALRYPDAKEGVQEQEKLLLVNTVQIVSTTRSFVNQLLSINKQ